MAWAKYVLDKETEKVGLTVVCIALVTDGSSCYYCFRGWHTIYRQRWTLTKYRAEVTFLVPLIAAVVSYLDRCVLFG